MGLGMQAGHYRAAPANDTLRSEEFAGEMDSVQVVPPSLVFTMSMCSWRAMRAGR